MTGYNCIRAAVIDRYLSRVGCADDAFGDPGDPHGWNLAVYNLYGQDYLYHESPEGFVTVEWHPTGTGIARQTFYERWQRCECDCATADDDELAPF